LARRAAMRTAVALAGEQSVAIKMDRNRKPTGPRPYLSRSFGDWLLEIVTMTDLFL
jgi:hypothetical protein